MAETGKKLSELVAELPTYHIVKDKYARDRASGCRRCSRRWRGSGRRRRPTATDGLRLDWADRWVHVRPSNTEPIVRVIAEAPQEDAAAGLCREVGGLLAG